MNKAHILQEIQRTAKANGGAPLGKGRFLAETGIKESDWLGRYWARWSDAVREAGFAPNRLQGAFDSSYLLKRFVQLIQELNRVPTFGELRLKSHLDPTFPNPKTFSTRWGGKGEIVKQVAEFCRTREEYKSIAQLCEAYTPKSENACDRVGKNANEFGFVYLVKSGRFYKIGRSNAAGRREYELGIQLPEQAKTVHAIRTDDPVGIEAYWHTRFGAKRMNGEWFALDSSDITAFKRRKFM